MILLLELIQNSKHLIANKKAEELLKSYYNIISKRKIDISPKQMSFPGPLPLSLSKKDFKAGIISSGYSVTDKADGERFLLYINDDGNGLFIPRDNAWTNLIYIGFINKSINNTIFDGELIGNNFYIFDCLVANKKDVTPKHLDKRLNEIDELLKQYNSPIKKTASINISKNKTKIKLIKKDFYFDIPDNASKIWKDRDKLPYNLDGLIFTPIYKPYKNDKIYKWKLDHTIDLKIKQRNVKGEYVYFYVQIKSIKDRIITHIDYKGYDGKRGLFKYKGGETHLHDPRSLFKNDIRIALETAKQNFYVNDAIVEFKVTKSKLIPIKRRFDKQDANGILAVNDVMYSVDDPLVITDFDKRPEYFSGRNFHNAIKSKLIKEHMGENKTVLDIGSGAGGDINKYIKHKTKYVVGIDFVDVKYKYPKKNMIYFRIPLNLIDNYNIKSIIGHPFKIQKFDVINCQFAFHYMLKTKETFENFIVNVQEKLKNGGYLVITCLDGEKLINRGDVNNSAVTIKHGEKSTGLFGNKVSIRIKGSKYFDAKVIDEYIVDIEELGKRFRKNDLHLVSEKSFESYCNEFKNECSVMSRDEKIYSFMNTVLIYEYKK